MGIRRVVIVGCGLTGPIIGIYLARRGCAVTLYDRGLDPRLIPPRMGKSINITLAERGLHSLAELGLRDHVQSAAVAVLGRRIHHTSGQVELQPYGNFGEALWSIGRSELNRLLVEAASAQSGLSMHFEHPCLALDLDSRSAVIRDARTGTETRVTADTFIGADGVHSIVRQNLQRRARFQYSQRYASHANKELHVPSDAGAPWMEHRDALHIWPRGQHMLISFPNTDGSVTCSLHMPYEGPVSYQSIQTGEQVRALFAKDFPDALPFIERLEESYLTRPIIPLLTIQCTPWSYDDRAVLMGDAAHAILPSYGQGANCCFEDCAVLNACLDKHDNNWADAFAEFERRRRPNTDAIAQLSEEHFDEIRDQAADAQFQRRKRMELWLNRANPDFFQSIYSLVSFSRMPYTEALQRQKQFGLILNQVLALPESAHAAVINRLARDPELYREILGVNIQQ